MKHNSEAIFKSIGCHHKYQILVSLIYILTTTFTDSSLFFIVINVTKPIINLTNSQKDDALTTDICINGNYSISKSFKSNMVSELRIECDSMKINNLYLIYQVGCLFSFIFIFIFKSYSKERLFKILSIIYFLSGAFIIYDHYILYLIFNFLLGFALVGITMLKVMIMTEIVCKKKRGLFIFGQFSNATTSAFFIFTLLSLDVSWKYCYLIGCGGVGIVAIVNIFFIVTNPRYLYLRNRHEDSEKASAYIKKINNYNDEVNQCYIEDNENIVCSKDKENNENNDEENNRKDEFLLKTRTSNDLEKMFDLNTEIENDSTDVDENNQIQTGKIENETSLVQEKSSVLNWNGILYKLKLLVAFFTSNIMNLFASIELKHYNTSSSSFNYSVILFGVAIVPLFVSLTILMNTKIFGRKYTLILNNIIILILRLVLIIFSIDNIILYIVIRLLVTASQLTLFTLIPENISNKTRVKDMAIFNLFLKLVAISIPFVFEFLSYFYYNLMCISLCSIHLITALFINETRGKDLNDD